MKKLLIAAFAVIVSLSSMAQKNLDKKQDREAFRKEGHFEEMSEKLNLTEEQKQQMKTMNETFKKQMQELKGNTGMAADEMKAKRQQLMKDHKEKMRAILTPEQQAKAQELKKEMKHDGKEGHGEKMNEMTKNLNLTADQTTKVNALNETLKTNMQNLKNNTALTEDQRKEEVKNMMQKHRSDVMALLTEEQKEQFKKNRKGVRKEK